MDNYINYAGQSRPAQADKGAVCTQVHQQAGELCRL